MNWIKSILGLILAAALLSGCTNEWTSNSEPLAHVEALVVAWNCNIPYDSTKEYRDTTGAIFDDFYLYQYVTLLDDTPSRRAKVTFKDMNNIAQTEFTDRSSYVEFMLNPGLYSIFIESSFGKTDTISDYLVSSDTSVVLEYVCKRRLLPGEGR